MDAHPLLSSLLHLGVSVLPSPRVRDGDPRFLSWRGSRDERRSFDCDDVGARRWEDRFGYGWRSVGSGDCTRKATRRVGKRTKEEENER